MFLLNLSLPCWCKNCGYRFALRQTHNRKLQLQKYKKYLIYNLNRG